MQIERNRKLITCILPAGVADEVVRRLESELGIIEAGVSKARGMGHLTPRRYGAGVETEKEILTVVVPEAQADDLFRFLFDAARIDRPHGGIMFMNPLMQATQFELPKIEE
ncbi:MAG TPA: P-II family nitrogen regulator [Thermoanaerobaculia bacterium]